jgi:hypothetical protein
MFGAAGEHFHADIVIRHNFAHPYQQIAIRVGLAYYNLIGSSVGVRLAGRVMDVAGDEDGNTGAARPIAATIGKADALA